MESTASLRKAAPQWSLAGDKQLFEVLQSMQQNLVRKCEEVNKELDEMISKLDDADISLQNVNNKFMALSNSQFIESRVYDDDDVTAEPAQRKEAAKPNEPESELEMLKRSIKVLQDMHEPVTIMVDSDSDTDSGDDGVARVVLKPKDIYGDRPLPYIIGSQQWKRKWHAGLVVEDSDTDSSVGARQPEDQYSEESDHEMDTRADTCGVRAQHAQDSSAGSVCSREAAPPRPAQSPAAVAAELARRLGANPPPAPKEDVEYSTPQPTIRKVYRQGQSTAGAIFSDEPPPLDQYQSESSEDDEGDIFAELHNKKPYSYSNSDQRKAAEELFSDLTDRSNGSDLFEDRDDDGYNNNVADDTGNKKESTSDQMNVKPKSLLENKQPKLPTPDIQQYANESQDDTSKKKPVGGISLFGTNKGTESIGAAILKRNRKMSTSDDSDDDKHDYVPNDIRKPNLQVEDSTKRDIFDDLFERSEKALKKVVKTPTEKNDQDKKVLLIESKKVDLFSDNIFDDIDDIFTTNVTKVTLKEPDRTKEQKSIFDDDDDLFADISVTNTAKSKPEKNIINSIFDTDDDLFNDNNDKPVVKTPENAQGRKDVKIEQTVTSVDNLKKAKSIFDDDNDIFSSISVSDSIGNEKSIEKAKIATANESFSKEKESDDGKEKLIMSMEEQTKTKADIVETDSTSIEQSKVEQLVPNPETKTTNIFDEDDEDIFINNNISNSLKESSNILDDIASTLPVSCDDELPKTVNYGEETTKIPAVLKTQKSIFDEDEDELFSNSKDKFSSNNLLINNNKQHHFAKASNEPIESLNENKSLFNDDDDIFADIINKQNSETSEEIRTTKIISVHENPEILHDEVNITGSSKESSATIKSTHIEQILQENTKDSANIDTLRSIPTDVNICTLPNKIKEVEINNLKVENSPHFQINPDKFKEADDNILPPVTANDTNNISETLNNNSSQIPAKTHNVSTEDNMKTEITSEKGGTYVFEDIFNDQPPIFEKPKEPKKSKNVNALFDDDSDDEALFFKKNDATLDEKPEVFSENARFGIFQDEPPAIGVDFIQKSNKGSAIFDINNDLFNTDIMFGKHDNIEPSKDIETINQSADKLFVALPKDIIDLKNSTVVQKEEDSLFSNKDTDKTLDVVPESRDNTDSGLNSVESKKSVGKLKPVNININVDTLLPGASPKKQKNVEKIDSHTLKTSEELNTSVLVEKTAESSMVKSVSFEGDPESAILDNKASKERAKIQVRRRPSTRRARREAVRKSGIDFGDDSTDNSLADDPPKKQEIIVGKPKANVTSKTVYILNDEDIFNTNNNNASLPYTIYNDEPTKYHENIVGASDTNTKSERINSLQDNVDDDDKMFTNVPPKNTDKTSEGITTLGKVYNEDTKTVKKEFKSNQSNDDKLKLIFDDASDDELFNKGSKAVAKNTNLFEYDSEEDLFKDSKSVIKKEVKKVVPKEVKPSLFDDDDEELFSVKVKQTEKNEPKTTSTTKETARDLAPPEPVFEDPLSMLGGDDEP